MDTQIIVSLVNGVSNADVVSLLLKLYSLVH